jgi:hypothetical protein
MKITIDTIEKTAIVHGEATFEEVVEAIKAVSPVGWNAYKLTCQNVPMLTFATSGYAAQISPGSTIANCKSANLTYTN